MAHNILQMAFKRRFSARSQAREIQPITRFAVAKKVVFKGIKFDDAGRFLVLHHRGAAFQYKLNFAFLTMFLGASFYNYVMNAQVFFGKEWFAKLYLAGNIVGVVGLWCFSHK
jgi:hypothetical protein